MKSLRRSAIWLLVSVALAVPPPAEARPGPRDGEMDKAVKVNSLARHERGVSLTVGLASGRETFYRVDVLTDHIIRVRAAAENSFQPTLAERDGFINVDWPAAGFDLNETAGRVTVDAGGITVRIDKNPLRVSFHQGDRPLLAELEDGGVAWDGSHPVLTMESPADERFLGFGDQGSGYSNAFAPDRAPLDHRGRGMLMAGISSERQYWMPFFMSSGGYGFFLNTLSLSIWDMARARPDRFSIELTGDRLDYFVIAGPSFKDVLKRYTDIVGRAPLPPRWELGVTVSTPTQGIEVDGRVPEDGMGTRWLDQKLIEAAARETREQHRPGDYFHLDSAWQTIRNSFDWVSQIPDPARMISLLNDLNYKVGLWQRPTLAADEYPLYHEAVKKGYLALGPDGKPFICPSKYGGPSGMVDFTNPEVVQWWQKKIEGFVAMGVRTFKLDSASSGFIEAYPEALATKFHNGLIGAELDNYYGGIYVKTVWDALKRALKGKRAVLHVYHQTYFAANRYPYMALGDRTRQSPQECRIRYALNYGLTGVPYWQGGDFGAFGLPLVDQETRLRLIPYTYTCWHIASATGLPLTRAMVLEFQDDPESYRADTQFLYGREFLVAPIVDEESRWRKVYLPDGEWFDYRDGEKYRGPGWKLFPARRGNDPIFVRGGAIIPMGPVLEYDGQKPLDPLTLDIYPSGESSFTLYEDDGDTYAYLSGRRATTAIACRPTEAGIEVEIGPAQGEYDGKLEQRAYVLMLHGVTTPRRIGLDNQTIPGYDDRQQWENSGSGWFYRMNNGTRRTLTIKLPPQRTNRTVRVLLEGSSPVRYYSNY